MLLIDVASLDSHACSWTSELTCTNALEMLRFCCSSVISFSCGLSARKVFVNGWTRRLPRCLKMRSITTPRKATCQNWDGSFSKIHCNTLCTSLEQVVFLDNQSGRDLVTVLRSMRTGVSMPDDVWERLAAREVDAGDLQSNQQLRQRFLSAHWGAFSWEQVGRLQQIQAGYEALNAQQTIYFVQAVDHGNRWSYSDTRRDGGCVKASQHELPLGICWVCCLCTWGCLLVFLLFCRRVG